MGATRKGECGVCRHVDRARIESAREAGVSFGALEARFGVAKTVLQRHWAHHIDAERKLSFLIGKTKIEDLRERAAEENLSLIEYLAIVRSGLMKQFSHQVENDSAFGAATVAARLLDVLREIGKITGEIARMAAPNTTINVSVNAAPGFADLQAGLLDIARAHPAARGDIVALLRRLDGAPEPVPRLPATIEHEGVHA